ncbi:hypothetical protein [Methylobacterium sp. PvR107]|uniref:hypothetical protein n=1 Tax=Methylobacterium sp. PvR107 TaxID=2806597 RepID=UPI001AE4965F|nr:hypothetical protein [Methylobacterium sp. PvR107]MBP1178240.1 hypothetical protein [Methylobacterium sp. PvR107]
MATIRHAVILGVLLGITPALAQSPLPDRAPGAVPTRDPGAVPARDPALTAPGGRRIAATGQTKPPGTAATGLPRPINEAEMIKAQKAAEARSKAWDAKMRNTMGSICHGC